MPGRACLMVPLLWLRLLRQGRWIRTPMQIFENNAMDLFTYVNVHCTNLRNIWAGYSPTNKWCLPKLLRRVQVVKLVVSTKDSICGCSASLCINIQVGRSSPWWLQQLFDKLVENEGFSLLLLLWEKSSRVTGYVIRDINPSAWQAEYDTYTHLMTKCLRLLGGVAGFRLHLFFLPLVMTSTGLRCVFACKCMN